MMLLGQLLYVAITLFHTGGVANNHHDIFAAYAASGTWTFIHVLQFFCMAILLGGLSALFFALDNRDTIVRWASRFGVGMVVVTLAICGVVLGIDGVTNKQVDVAWVNAPAAEKAARFASAEAVRWIEWGLRSYENFALGLAVILFAVSVLRTTRIPRMIGYLMGLSGFIYLAQGWIAGSEGFSSNETVTIILAEIVNAIWMIWLVVFAWKQKMSESKTQR